MISTATNTVTATITGFSNPYGICVSPDGSRVYVANVNANTISVINAATNTIINTITFNSPQCISPSPDGSKIYVTNWADYKVYAINTATNTFSDTIAVDANPEGVFVTLTGARYMLQMK